MNAHDLRARARARRRTRGAALLEAVIVISTMLVFFGLIAYTRTSYGEKLDQQSTTRRDALYYASHACEGGRPQGTKAAADNASPGTGGAAQKFGQKTREESANALGSEWNMASASRDSKVYGTMAVDANAETGAGKDIRYRKVPLQRSIHAESHVACNEKRYDNQWTAWLEYGVAWAKSGGM